MLSRDSAQNGQTVKGDYSGMSADRQLQLSKLALAPLQRLGLGKHLVHLQITLTTCRGQKTEPDLSLHLDQRRRNHHQSHELHRDQEGKLQLSPAHRDGQVSPAH